MRNGEKKGGIVKGKLKELTQLKSNFYQVFFLGGVFLQKLSSACLFLPRFCSKLSVRTVF